MLVYYVDWWDEDEGLLRRHFGNSADASKHFHKVKRSSSGSTVKRKVELKQTKDAMLATLNHISLGEPIDPYPGSTQLLYAVATVKVDP